jgi:hypothetical protein
VWGITIWGATVQNELQKMLHASFIQFVPQGNAIIYIPELSTFPLQTRLEVQAAFVESLEVLWQVLAGISGIGVVASLLMEGSRSAMHSVRIGR